eukprot:scaffold149168_cov33-Tisochrysis_lutea.AAC.5
MLSGHRLDYSFEEYLVTHFSTFLDLRTCGMFVRARAHTLKKCGGKSCKIPVYCLYGTGHSGL